MCHVLYSCFLKRFIYLKARIREGGVRKREISSIYSFSPQIVTVASTETGTKTFFHVSHADSRDPKLGPCSTAFFRPSAWDRIRSGVAGTWASAYTECWYRGGGFTDLPQCWLLHCGFLHSSPFISQKSLWDKQLFKWQKWNKHEILLVPSYKYLISYYRSDLILGKIEIEAWCQFSMNPQSNEDRDATNKAITTGCNGSLKGISW